MEGVVATVRQSGSTIATSVVSDAQGHYRFPRGRLAVGDYAVSIKAAGFDLDNAAPISIAASQSKIADLQLARPRTRRRSVHSTTLGQEPPPCPRTKTSSWRAAAPTATPLSASPARPTPPTSSCR